MIKGTKIAKLYSVTLSALVLTAPSVWAVGMTDVNPLESLEALRTIQSGYSDWFDILAQPVVDRQIGIQSSNCSLRLLAVANSSFGAKTGLLRMDCEYLQFLEMKTLHFDSFKTPTNFGTREDIEIRAESLSPPVPGDISLNAAHFMTLLRATLRSPEGREILLSLAREAANESVYGYPSCLLVSRIMTAPYVGPDYTFSLGLQCGETKSGYLTARYIKDRGEIEAPQLVKHFQ